MVSLSLFWSLETPVHQIAIEETDRLLSNSISLALEDLFVENKSGSFKPVLHLVVIQYESGDIPELS